LDPILLEESLAHGTLSIALNAQGEICVLQKNGGVPLDQEEILRLIDIVVQRAREVDTLVERRLKEDWEGRNIEIR
jgi:exosome complex component RRP45